MSHLRTIVSGIAARAYYRLTISGTPILSRGPLLLVANHPNALLDPVLVVIAARRPVRFLAKAPLFTDPSLGWLMRAVGSIPVYRRHDDPSLTARNVEMFLAVHRELSDGAAVGLFPEGISHADPSLAPLRTGAARIAIGAFEQRSRSFPIVPVGLVFRGRDRFRSEALVVLGQPVEWEDLGPRGLEDGDAVRELTARIEGGLRQVTLNLEHWEDRPLVECAEAIWSTERGADPDPARALARLGATTRILADLRRRPSPEWDDLVRDVRAHGRRLRRLRLRPADLTLDSGWGTGARWALRRLYLLGFPFLGMAAAGYLLYRPPNWLTGWLAGASGRTLDQRSTWQAFLGVLIYPVWTVLLAALAGWAWGPWAALGSLVGIPTVGVIGLWLRERWRGAVHDVRRFFTLRGRGELMGDLRGAQRNLADRLEALYEDRGQT